MYAQPKRAERNIIEERRVLQLEKLLTDASKPGGKTELSGKDLGIPKLEKAKVQLYDFSTKELSITPTEVTSRYRQVSLEELMKMLVALL